MTLKEAIAALADELEYEAGDCEDAGALYRLITAHVKTLRKLCKAYGDAPSQVAVVDEIRSKE